LRHSSNYLLDQPTAKSLALSGPVFSAPLRL
jgi:hypothetical protein